MSVFFSVQAEADLEGIADYIAADSPARRNPRWRLHSAHPSGPFASQM